MKTLTQFTQPAILKTIGALRLALFLSRNSQDDLKAANIPLPTSEEDNDDYFSALATAFARLDSEDRDQAAPLPLQRGEGRGRGEGSVFASAPDSGEENVLRL